MLKFLKVVITFIKFDAEGGNAMAEIIVQHVFSLAKPEKYTMMIRRILNKLISRIGVQPVMQMTSVKH